MAHLMLLAAVIALCGMAAAMPATAQDACPVPDFFSQAAGKNIFSEQQENYLGDAVMEQLRNDYRIIDNELTDTLRRIGRRLLEQLPPSGLKFEFHIVDYPQINAFCLPGGRILVTRKLISATRNEDELAAVIGHEIGHAVMRHKAVEFTRAFQAVLRVDAVGDRDDIFLKYNSFIDNIARRPGILKQLSRYNERAEITADRISVYLAKRAGYDPGAGAAFWNDILDVGGRTGNFLSNFFGTTSPEETRLREMLRTADLLPAACAGARAETTGAQYEEWKASVAAYSGLGRRELLPEAEWKQLLNPHLRGNITHMRFSPDGNYLLAQDFSSIFVLSRNPFDFLFRIDSRDAFPAQFTPDSRHIVFHTFGLRVEKWAIEEGLRAEIHEPPLLTQCLESSLSPDARHLACLDNEFALTIYDVTDGSKVFTKAAHRTTLALTGFIAGFGIGLNSWRHLSSFAFSHDGRYFLAGSRFDNMYHAYDFAEGKQLKLPSSISSRLRQSFAFMSGNRFVGVDGKTGEKSAIISFPDGAVLHEFQVGLSNVTPVSSGDYLILRPIDGYAAGVMDPAQNKVFMASKQDALDMYNGYFASERVDGVLYLFHADQAVSLGQVELPRSPLPRPRAIAISDDMNWLAVSEISRGAIWNLRDGNRVFLSRNFNEAHFTAQNMLLVDYPKSGQEERMLALINPETSDVTPVTRLDNRETVQAGPYLVQRHEASSAGGKRGEPALSVSRAENAEELWMREFPKELPWINLNSKDDRMVLLWGTWSGFVKEASRKDAALRRHLYSDKRRDSDYYVEVVQASTGAMIGKMIIETGLGSFRPRWAEAAGDFLMISDTQNRLLVYSISSGNRLGQIFGINGSISPAARLLVAENAPGVLSVYSLPDLVKLRELVFADRLSYVSFVDDGNRLFILTAGQQSYRFDTEQLSLGTF